MTGGPPPRKVLPFRRGSIALATAAVIALGIAAARVDVPRFAGPVKGDEATYVLMAFSLADDGDLKYRREDFQRFVALYHSGPEGVFLKRTFQLRPQFQAGWPPLDIRKAAVPTTEELAYGKPFAYAVAAAPFAAIFGLGGLLLLNIVLLGLCVLCAVLFARAQTGRRAGTLIGLGFIAASVVPVYGAWLTPEIFNFTLILASYFLWLYKEGQRPGTVRARLASGRGS